MKRGLCLALALMLLPLAGLAAEAGMTVRVEGTARPWEAVLILFTLPEEEQVDLTLTDGSGKEIFVIARAVQGWAGQNSLYWNGTYDHEAAPAGEWTLRLEGENGTAETPIRVEAAESAEAADDDGNAEREAPVQTEEPRMTAPPSEEEIYGGTEEDDEEIFAAELAEGTPAEDAAALTAEAPAEEYIPGPGFTPAYTSPYAGQDRTLNYWTVPMNIADEERVWQALTAPITVVDKGKGEKSQVVLRQEPSADSPGVGVVTCETQGVHVLQRGEEWSLVECYSSSFHDSKILNWNALVQGYVRTEYLRQITPNQEMGLVVDKLTQRLYVFREGHLYSTLLVSTGLSNEKQPYNETRSGEFLLTSKVGTFQSEELLCGKAIRFNKGDLLHEVPHTVDADGKVSYAAYEARLGTKASHGCIRVQRRKTPEGVNMAWIWAKLKKNSQTRMLIWEDWQGRQMETPAADTPLYYTTEKGQYYHSQATCGSIKAGVDTTQFAYAQLEEEPYAQLKKCPWCAPPLRPAEIARINSAYAPGGDHDPVMTKALESCPRER